MSADAEQLKAVQIRLKKLQTYRDQLNRDVAVAESKLQQAYQQLRDLGIVDPETKTSQVLQTLAEGFEKELTEKVAELLTKVEEGEALMAKYLEIQGQ